MKRRYFLLLGFGLASMVVSGCQAIQRKPQSTLTIGEGGGIELNAYAITCFLAPTKTYVLQTELAKAVNAHLVNTGQIPAKPSISSEEFASRVAVSALLEEGEISLLGILLATTFEAMKLAFRTRLERELAEQIAIELGCLGILVLEEHPGFLQSVELCYEGDC